jgi:histidyl-tRNA synthetase
MNLSNQPPKGTSDWLPEEFKIRQFIFDAWRRVCQRYGYEEYLTPLVESAEIYRAKSGEDVGGKELVTFKDLGGRELSIRPEMTPSVTRLVSRIYEARPKPIRYFSIANFMRNEKPQRGRNREFWQLNCDIFGSNSLSADVEILQIALDIMLELGAPKKSFVLAINSRKLLDGIFDLMSVSIKDKTTFFRILDKYKKINSKEFINRLENLGADKVAINQVSKFMKNAETNPYGLEKLIDATPTLKSAYQEIKNVIDTLVGLGYDRNFIEFNPAIIRGFDYYDGLVFEVFDKNAKNNRAMFGGGRYNGLANIFGAKTFPAVGFAPGDETTRLFLESWGLTKQIKAMAKDIYYLPLLDKSLTKPTAKLAKILRAQGLNVVADLEEQKINKALEYANKQSFTKVVIFGSEELKKKVYKIKDMANGKEKNISLK